VKFTNLLMKDCCFDLEKVCTYFFENTGILYNRTSLFCLPKLRKSS